MGDEQMKKVGRKSPIRSSHGQWAMIMGDGKCAKAMGEANGERRQK